MVNLHSTTKSTSLRMTFQAISKMKAQILNQTPEALTINNSHKIFGASWDWARTLQEVWLSSAPQINRPSSIKTHIITPITSSKALTFTNSRTHVSGATSTTMEVTSMGRQEPRAWNPALQATACLVLGAQAVRVKAPPSASPMPSRALDLAATAPNSWASPATARVTTTSSSHTTLKLLRDTATSRLWTEGVSGYSYAAIIL